MKLPISFLLYTSSLGLAGFTGWQVYELLPLQKREAKDAAMRAGQNAATDKLTAGRGNGPISVDWRYSETNRKWWEGFKGANFLGTLPPPPPDPEKAREEPVIVEKPVVPLENIFELALLVYDGQDKGQGELSHVVVRYKPESGVVAPEWYVRQAQTSPSSFGGPGDGVPPPRPGGNPGFQGGKKGGPDRSTSVMPTSTQQPTILLQKVWIKGGGDAKRDPHLWPPFEHIRLVAVAPNAQSAFFVREVPPKDDEPEAGEKREQLFKTAANLSQEVLRAIDALNGEEGRPATGNPQARAPQNTWTDTDETVVTDNRWNVGRKDEQAFQAEEDFFDKLYVDTYVSKLSDRRGLIVRNVDPQLSAKFGVAQGDVLLSVNNRPVKTKAAAVQFGKKEYSKGVRSFVTVWLSGGQEVERVYQLPDK